MITVTDAAQTQLRRLISADQEAAMALRIYVESGGCSGFSYGMGIDENAPRDDDVVVEVGWLRVHVDAFSAQYLDGAEVDYVDALMGGGFTIHNPNATKTCGCGHSFQTADSAGSATSCAHA